MDWTQMLTVIQSIFRISVAFQINGACYAAAELRGERLKNNSGVDKNITNGWFAPIRNLSVSLCILQ